MSRLGLDGMRCNVQGQWWETGAQEAVPMSSLRQGEQGTAEGASEEDGVGEDGRQGSLAALAASQRFSSPAARAAFCIIMGASDYLDAAERLQRAGLKVPTTVISLLMMSRIHA